MASARLRLFAGDKRRRQHRQGADEDEARRIASNIAKLPTILVKALLPMPVCLVVVGPTRRMRVVA
jgi:hypothetical protein